MAKPSHREDTLPHTSPRAETGRSVAGLLCGFRNLSAHDICWGKSGMSRQNRSAMRQRIWRCVVSTTIHANLASSRKTLVRQTDGVAAGAARRLKILVSVVRFRPGPPRTFQAKRRSMQIGVFVSGARSPRARPIPYPTLSPVRPSSWPKHPVPVCRCFRQRRRPGSLDAAASGARTHPNARNVRPAAWH